jgi:predicted nucleic acid-binding Zn ribbon protein
MERAGDFLGRTLRRLERPEAALSWLNAAWPHIVGASLAAHTRPVRCDQGCLEISINGNAWKKELEDLKPQFTARINQAWGGTLVREIQLVAARAATASAGSAANNSSGPAPRRLPRELDNDHTPFIRRKKGSP